MQLMASRERRPSKSRASNRASARACLPASLVMATTLSTSVVFERNPYEGHPSLTELEAEVLWEYAKLSQNVKEVRLSSC